jgi:ribosomal protein L18
VYATCHEAQSTLGACELFTVCSKNLPEGVRLSRHLHQHVSCVAQRTLSCTVITSPMRSAQTTHHVCGMHLTGAYCSGTLAKKMNKADKAACEATAREFARQLKEKGILSAKMQPGYKYHGRFRLFIDTLRRADEALSIR